MILVFGVWPFVRALLVNSATVSLENVALRHQLAVLQRSVNRPRFRAATASSGSISAPPEGREIHQGPMKGRRLVLVSLRRSTTS
jgi:hypothetical protein